VRSIARSLRGRWRVGVVTNPLTGPGGCPKPIYQVTRSRAGIDRLCNSFAPAVLANVTKESTVSERRVAPAPAISTVVFAITWTLPSSSSVNVDGMKRMALTCAFRGFSFNNSCTLRPIATATCSVKPRDSAPMIRGPVDFGAF
jgi:hypothetical protein